MIDRSIMSRPMVLVFLLMILIITSQFEWRQQLVMSEVEVSPSISQKRIQIANRKDGVKENIILNQEKTIQRLNELVRNLQVQLRRCKGNFTINGRTSRLTENINELEQQQQQPLED